MGLCTDEIGRSAKLGTSFTDHWFTSHRRDDYVRGIVHTNTAEGHFSVLKYVTKDTYQHCGKQHLHRYPAGRDFSYDHKAKLGIGDVDRAGIALRSIVGKRLTYGG